MTISSMLLKNVYTGDGSTILWPFTFSYGSVEEIKLYLSTNGATPVLITTNFEVDEVELKVTYPVDGVPLTAIHELTLIRETAQEQELDLINGGPYNAENVEAAFDKLTRWQIEQAETLSRCVKFPVSATGADEITNSEEYLAEIVASQAAAAASAAAAAVSASAASASAVTAAAQAAAAVVSAASATASAATASAAVAATAASAAAASASAAAALASQNAAAASAAAAAVSATASSDSATAAAASAVAAAASAAAAAVSATNASNSAIAAAASAAAAGVSQAAAAVSAAAAAASAVAAAAAVTSAVLYSLPNTFSNLQALAVVGRPMIARATDLGIVVFYSGDNAQGDLGNGWTGL